MPSLNLIERRRCIIEIRQLKTAKEDISKGEEVK
jgi:hypothetical protein